MKILAVNWLDLENPQAGGAEVHFFELFARIAASDVAVTLICSGWRGAPSRTTIRGIDVIRVGDRHSFAALGRGAVRRALRETDYDVLVEDVNKLPLFTASLTRIPVYVIIPHLFGTTAFQEASLPVASVVWLAERFIPWAYRRAEFHAISRSTREDLVARGIAGDRVRVIFPGVDCDVFAPGPPEGRAGVPSFLYVGRLKRYKGVDVAIRALAMLRGEYPLAILKIAGNGDDRPRLQRLARSLGLEDAVQFLGYVSEEDKLALLRSAWALIFPSLKEGWGITNVEGAACGTPAIAADSPGLRESVVHDRTGLLVPPGDVSGFARAMGRIAADAAMRDCMGLEARTFALSLSWDDAARQTREHLEDVVVGIQQRGGEE